MRKILTSVLSVAGLLAVVLALASSPASAAKDVVTIQSPDAAGNAGTYTISWETQGGCDPGSGTSGASGSVTLTVAESTPGGGQGAQAETGIVIDDICNYTWKVSFTNAAGAECLVGIADGADDDTNPDRVVTAATITLATGDCAVMGDLEVTVRGHGAVYVGDCIAESTVADTTHSDAACTTEAAGSGTHRLAVLDDTSEKAAKDRDKKDAPTPAQLNAGAVGNTIFTVTATPEKNARGVVPKGCLSVSKDTELVYLDGGLNSSGGLQRATLKVVDRPLGGTDTTCTYTVTAELPAGFAAGGGEERSKANSATKQNPDDDGADNDAGTDCDTAPTVGGCADNGPVKSSVTVSVGTVKVYLVQNVIGDAGGAAATYKMDTPCGAPGLPAALTARSDAGGISTVKASNVVELRTGRFNVTAALADNPAAEGAADGVTRSAIAEDGKACEATVSISGVPDHCSADGVSASLASATGSVILEVTVDCSPPPAPEPPAEEPMDDTGDMGGDDMGSDDMGADDMGADDMGSDDMGSDDMGPPEDTPTG